MLAILLPFIIAIGTSLIAIRTKRANEAVTKAKDKTTFQVPPFETKKGTALRVESCRTAKQTLKSHAI